MLPVYTTSGVSATSSWPCRSLLVVSFASRVNSGPQSKNFLVSVLLPRILVGILQNIERHHLSVKCDTTPISEMKRKNNNPRGFVWFYVSEKCVYINDSKRPLDDTHLRKRDVSWPFHPGFVSSKSAWTNNPSKVLLHGRSVNEHSLNFVYCGPPHLRASAHIHCLRLWPCDICK